MNERQKDFFHTFGFIKFPGLLKDDIDWITAEFEQVFPMFPNLKHDGTKRTMIIPFVDQREKLCALLDHPAVRAIGQGLLGDDFNYMGSDGNYYTGNTMWHPDGLEQDRLHIKIAFYLDPLDGKSGALRVVPGSHRFGDAYHRDVQSKVVRSKESWGIEGDEVPSQVLDVTPGDVLVFNHATLHSSWGGSAQRRMFTLNVCERYRPEHLEQLRDYLLRHSHYARERYYGKTMIETAGAERRKHLEQVMSVDGEWAERTNHLPRLQ